MSIGNISQHEWLNRNSLRAFPVMENAVPKLNDGRDLPASILVDLFLVASLPGPGGVYLSSVFFTIRTVTVILSDVATNKSIGYATAILGSTPPDSSVAIQSPDGFGSGTVTFGQILDERVRTDFAEFLGAHPQAATILIDQRCYLYAGKPMVESIRADLQDGSISGNATITLGKELRAEVTQITINGVAETQVELSLVSPENFLPDCYPKYIDPLCYCGKVPVVTVNGVPRDEDGDLGIDIVFGTGVAGVISNKEDENLLEVTIVKPGNEVCVENPIVPDEFGRLGPDFDQDCPPDTDYGLGIETGPACDSPPPRPPSNAPYEEIGGD